MNDRVPNAKPNFLSPSGILNVSALNQFDVGFFLRGLQRQNGSIEFFGSVAPL